MEKDNIVYLHYILDAINTIKTICFKASIASCSLLVSTPCLRFLTY